MKSNQSLHITIKKPPNPNPVKTLGIFEDTSYEGMQEILQHFLSSNAGPKDPKFIGNVKDEVMKLLLERNVIAVSRLEDGSEVIYLGKVNTIGAPNSVPASDRPRISR